MGNTLGATPRVLKSNSPPHSRQRASSVHRRWHQPDRGAGGQEPQTGRWISHPPHSGRWREASPACGLAAPAKSSELDPTHPASHRRVLATSTEPGGVVSRALSLVGTGGKLTSSPSRVETSGTCKWEQSHARSHG